MANIKYRPLKAFLLAVETSSFVLAAERLCVTPPSFTALIQDLELVLGVKLFDRTTRKIELTAAGEEFYSRIKHPLDGLEEAYQSMHDLASVRRGVIVLGALPSVAITLVPSALRLLTREHPALKIRVVEAYNDELITLLRTNQVEFALGAMLTPIADLVFRPLMLDRFVAVYAPENEHCLPDPLCWRDLIDHDVILTTHGSTPRALFDSAVRDTPGATTSIYEVTHMTTALGMVQQGLGTAILPRLALSELNLGSLRFRVLSDKNTQRMLGILRREDRSLSPAAEAFLTQVAHVVASMPGKD